MHVLVGSNAVDFIPKDFLDSADRIFQSMKSMPKPEIAVLVSSYERPHHLLRVLHSIACQVDVDGLFEVVVTDDGSEDETQDLVLGFAEQLSFRVGFTSHPHQTYQLARCRNEGVRASIAPYLLFLDGDCLISPDHLSRHLRQKQREVVYAGYCAQLSEQATEKIDIDSVRSGRFMSLAKQSELKKLAQMDRKSRLYNWLRHATKPKLFGGNVGIHRSDYETINGYDESFQGWGCEDDDLRLRLRRSGIQIRSILRWTRTYHLWHPPGVTTPDEWKEGQNVARLQDKHRPVYCQRGLYQRARDWAA